jgi:hypothetical protein
MSRVAPRTGTGASSTLRFVRGGLAAPAAVGSINAVVKSSSSLATSSSSSVKSDLSSTAAVGAALSAPNGNAPAPPRAGRLPLSYIRAGIKPSVKSGTSNTGSLSATALKTAAGGMPATSLNLHMRRRLSSAPASSSSSPSAVYRLVSPQRLSASLASTGSSRAGARNAAAAGAGGSQSVAKADSAASAGRRRASVLQRTLQQQQRVERQVTRTPAVFPFARRVIFCRIGF